MITGTSNYDETPLVICPVCGGYYKADEPENHDCRGMPVKDEDLDRCPRCKEDMWAGNDLCRNCQREDELEEWHGGDGNPFVITTVRMIYLPR